MPTQTPLSPNLNAAMARCGVTAMGCLPQGAALRWSNNRRDNDYLDYQEYELTRTAPLSASSVQGILEGILKDLERSKREQERQGPLEVMTALKAGTVDILPGINFNCAYAPAGRPGKIEVSGKSHIPLRLRDGRVALMVIHWDDDSGIFEWNATHDQVQGWLLEHGPRYSIQQAIDALYPPSGHHWVELCAAWDLLSPSLQRQRPVVG